jgi:hypothetical protein
MKISWLFPILLACILSFGCKPPASQHNMSSDSFAPIDMAAIERITGLKPIINGSECKVQVAQNDLDVQVDGFRIIPAMGLATTVGFTPSTDGAMVMGDLVLTRNDVEPVQAEVIRQGLTITAVHNHFVDTRPEITWMHVGGSGATEVMAQKVKTILDRIKQLRGQDPGAANIAAVQNTIDTTLLNSILLKPGRMTNKGVYRFAVDHPEVKVMEHGVRVSNFMATGMWFAWQGSNERAAVSGEFTLLEDEVAPVVKTLVENGIQVAAIHSHMVMEQPRFFFLHLWGVGDAGKLARGIRAALDKVEMKSGMQMNH